MVLEYSGKSKPIKKPRHLDHNYKEQPAVMTEDEAFNKKVENTLLRSEHVLETIESKVKDLFIPVHPDAVSVISAVKRLDQNSPDGNKIYFSFYKQLLESYYKELYDKIYLSRQFTNIPEVDEGIIRKSSISNVSDMDPELVGFIKNGASYLYIALLHEVLKGKVGQQISKYTVSNPESAGALAVDVAMGLAAQGVLGLINDGLSSLLATETKTTTIDEEYMNTLRDSSMYKAFSAIMGPDDRMAIFDYVDNYLKNNYEKELKPWVYYKSLYDRVYSLYVVYTEVVESPTIEDSFSSRNIKNVDSSRHKDKSKTNINDVVKSVLDFSISRADNYTNSVVAALSNAKYVQNAICCIFKYFIKIDKDFLRKLLNVLKCYKKYLLLRIEIFPSNISFSWNCSLMVLDYLSDIIDDLVDELNIAYLEGSSVYSRCFMVKDFIDMTTRMVEDFKNRLFDTLSVYIHAFDYYSKRKEWEIKVYSEIDEIDDIIALMEYVINLQDVCEVENPDDSRAVAEVNNFVSNYVNPSLFTFEKPSWSKVVTPTEENSFYYKKELVIDDNKKVIINPTPLSKVTIETYITCDEQFV